MITVLAFLALAAAAPQQPTPAEVGLASDPKAVKFMHSIGQCIARTRTVQTRDVLAMDFRTEAYTRRLRKLARLNAECHIDWARVPGLRSGGLLFAGSLAEGLLRRDEMLNDLGARTAYRPGLPAVEARNAGELMAFCVTRKSPNEVAALLATEPASEAEYHAIGAMSGTLTACVPANSKSSFTREALRALLALGSYRLAANNAGTVRVGEETGK